MLRCLVKLLINCKCKYKSQKGNNVLNIAVILVRDMCIFRYSIVIGNNIENLIKCSVIILVVT